MKSSRGFTLIEASIWVFVLAVALGALIQSIATAVTAKQQETTQSRQQTIISAVRSYLYKNSRLPCPADSTIVSGAANDGVEVATPGTCAGLPVNNGVVTGSVPWATLGLLSNIAQDPYGHRLTYVVTLAATNLTADSITGMKGTITVHSAGLGTTANQTNDCTPIGTTYNPCSAVLAIISHGPDGYGSYNNNGTQFPYPAEVTGNDERENSNGDEKIVVKEKSSSVSNPYDDLVLSVTAEDMLAPLRVSKNAEASNILLRFRFNRIAGSIIADAIKNTSTYCYLPFWGTCWGGTYRYYPLPTAIPSSFTPAQISDPWGNTVTYARLTAEIYKQSYSFAPVNDSDPAFTLTSQGQDGQPGTSDDVTVTYTVQYLRLIFNKIYNPTYW